MTAACFTPPWFRRALVAAGLLAAGGCSGRFGAPDPATEQGESVIDLWRALLLAATVLGLIVVGLAAIAVVRFRRRPGDADLPRQDHGHGVLEAVYVAIPLGVVIGFFAYTLQVDDIVTARADETDVVVEVTGYRWGWRFDYVGEDVLIESIAGQQPEVVLPVGATVRLRLRSSDVIHSLFVPEFLTKRDLIPGLTTDLDVDLTRTGRFLGHCAEYCGLDHARMNFELAVVEPGEYERWLADQREAG